MKVAQHFSAGNPHNQNIARETAAESFLTKVRSAVRYTDCKLTIRVPSTKVLGYYQPSALRTTYQLTRGEPRRCQEVKNCQDEDRGITFFF
jgi:hypothetical protein